MVLIMRTNDEIYETVIERKNKYEENKKRRNKCLLSTGAVAIVLAVCITAGVAAQRGEIISKEAEGGADSGATYPGLSGYEEQTAVSYANDEDESPTEAMTGYTGKEMQTAQAVYGGAEVPDEDGSETTTAEKSDGSGGESGGFCIPAPPFVSGAKPGIKVTGERITDEEANKFFEDNTWIASALSSSGVPADELAFSQAGYCHVSYDGVEGKQLEVRENFRDYLVYNGGKLVAIVTLTKENGKLSATPAFGGPHFDDYDSFLKAHKGEKLLYVYAGFMEIVITPDNRCFNPQGSNVSEYMAGVDNPYEYFYSESATYIP